MNVTTTSQEPSTYRQIITAAGQTFFADMSVKDGEEATAPKPHELLLGAWGACTNMTLQVYARRKGWPLAQVSTTLEEHAEGTQTRFTKTIQVWGDLQAEQVEVLKRVAEKCPINQLMVSDASRKIVTTHMVLEAV